MRKLFCALGLCLVAGCWKQGVVAGPAAASPAPSAKPAKLLVVATIAPMFCFTKNVAADLADVELASQPPSGQQFQRADVIVQNGFGFEKWLDQWVEQGGINPARRVLAARGTGPGVPGLPGDPDSPPADAPDLSGPPDPHVWLDPVMAIKEVQNIRDALMARDPAHADQYSANEDAYEAKLRDLDDQVGRFTVDLQKRRLFCPDPAFNYFLSRYEFTIAQDAKNADAIVVKSGSDAAPWTGEGLPVITLDAMETGPASTDFYETATLVNTNALRAALTR
jgi:ABC-type Zn uptake system ZnuABC Zn-binding protein ZnuA